MLKISLFGPYYKDEPNKNLHLFMKSVDFKSSYCLIFNLLCRNNIFKVWTYCLHLTCITIWLSCCTMIASKIYQLMMQFMPKLFRKLLIEFLFNCECIIGFISESKTF